jgi:hypothetical protein
MSDLLLLQARREPGDSVGVDREQKALLGFVVARKGEARGHGFELDDMTLDQIVELGNAVSGGVKLEDRSGLISGPKMRFTHPSKYGDTLGTYLGRVRNFRREGDSVRADGFFGRSAFKSPKYGDMATYLMDLAEEDPESFGASVAIKHSLETVKGQKPKLRVSKMPAVDFVGEAAATDAVFSADFPVSDVLLEEPAVADSLKTEPTAAPAPEVPKEPEKGAELSVAQKEAEQTLRAIAQETEQLRCEGIANLCIGLSCPELIPGMIGEGVSLLSAREKTKAYLAAKNPPLPAGTAPTDQPPAPEDPGKEYREQYKQLESMLSEQGIDEEGYVQSCLRTEKGGFIPLVSNPRKAG